MACLALLEQERFCVYAELTHYIHETFLDLQQITIMSQGGPKCPLELQELTLADSRMNPVTTVPAISVI